MIEQACGRALVFPRAVKSLFQEGLNARDRACAGMITWHGASIIAGPKPFANNTEMCFWMLMLSNKPPVYVSEEKQIMIYIAVPLYKEEYELVQSHGLGELGRRFDENKIYPHQMFFRKNVGIE